MVLGLTGFSGAGKSTVAALLTEYGYYHLDCDRIVHQEVYRDPIVLAAISAVFGADTVTAEGIDRTTLRKRTMGDPKALDLLNQTVMPFIRSAIEEHLDAHKDEKTILDAPLLFEYGLDRRCTYTLSVLSDRKTALARIMQRDGIKREEAQKRLDSQPPASFYEERSDFVLYNDLPTHELKARVEQIVNQISL